MLDVHPPEHAAHTWRDFFIHIATIVIGLLIAIGLEQTVEFFHHRHQVKDTREALRQERENNHSNYAFNLAVFRYDAAILSNDALVFSYLKQHPGTPMERLPGTLRWTFVYDPAQDVAWKAAQQTGITALMPASEVSANQALYKVLSLADNAALQVWDAIGKAQQFSTIDPDPSHLSPAQVNTELDLLGAAMDANYRWGLLLYSVHGDFPEFAPGPSLAELSNLLAPGLDSQQTTRLAAPNALTNSRIASADAALKTAFITNVPDSQKKAEK